MPLFPEILYPQVLTLHVCNTVCGTAQGPRCHFSLNIQKIHHPVLILQRSSDIYGQILVCYNAAAKDPEFQRMPHDSCWLSSFSLRSMKVNIVILYREMRPSDYTSQQSLKSEAYPPYIRLDELK